MWKLDFLKIKKDWTVPVEYQPSDQKIEWQSSRKIVQNLKNKLLSLGYEDISKGFDEIPKFLEKNLRNQLSLLNHFQFSDREWSDFLNNFIFQLGDGKKGRIEKIQKGELYELKDENDRIIKNVRLVNKRELSKNKLQFICQDERNEVIIFINGLPFVLISIFEFNSPLQSSFQAWKIINSL
ncbi:type I restriction endonuclease, partial [Mycoplasmoides pneumoniae]